MRDILFKAKRKNWKELPKEEQWVYGYYVIGLNTYEEPIHIIFEPTTIFGENGKTDRWVEIDPDTICQYTGLTDDDGEKIWECDILRTYDCTTEDYIVVWSIEKGAYVIASSRKTDDKYTSKVGNVIYEEHEDLVYEVLSEGGLHPVVIGNIFDNPELLEG